MVISRPADARGRGTAPGGWLDSRHSFSFGQYYDPGWMGFGALRVINEDRVAAGAGFAPHRHANMEILSYVLSGRLAHRDSSGAEGVIGPGELQWMSAGHGVTHSEYNASPDEPVHFLQIWLQPDRVNATPAWAQRPASDAPGWQLVASPDGSAGSLAIRQDARLYRLALRAGEGAAFDLDPARRYWVHVVSGELASGGDVLRSGDAVGLVDEDGALALEGGADGAELLLFELPGPAGAA